MYAKRVWVCGSCDRTWTRRKDAVQCCTKKDEDRREAAFVKFQARVKTLVKDLRIRVKTEKNRPYPDVFIGSTVCPMKRCGHVTKVLSLPRDTVKPLVKAQMTRHLLSGHRPGA